MGVVDGRMVGHVTPHCAAAAAPGSEQAMRRNGSWPPCWILAKFQITSVFRMIVGWLIGRKGGEDELPRH